MNLRARLFLSFVALASAVVLPGFFVTRFVVESQFRSYIYQGDVQKARAYSPLIEEAYAKLKDWKQVDPLLDQPPFSFHAIPMMGGMGVSIHQEDAARDQDWIRERIVVIDTGNRVVIDTNHLLEGSSHPAAHLVEAVPLRNGEALAGYLFVGTMADSDLGYTRETYLGTLTTSLLVQAVGALAIAMLLALLLSRSIAKPIVRLSDAAQLISTGERAVALPMRGDDEIAQLTRNFNQMSQTIGQAEDYRARLLADAAHEIRTPVTLIKGTLEAILDGVFVADQNTLKPVFDETVRLTSLLDALDDLESIQVGRLVSLELDVVGLLRSQCQLFQAAAKQKSIKLYTDLPELPVMLLADPQRLRQVFSNLLSNAMRHTPSGGRILVAAATSGSELCLRFEDSGPGIPPEERERVFERLYRLEESRSTGDGGRGLGLTICRKIVQAHQGRITVETSRFGGAALVVCLIVK